MVFSDKTQGPNKEISARIELLNPKIADALSVAQKDLSINDVRRALKIDPSEGSRFAALCRTK